MLTLTRRSAYVEPAILPVMALVTMWFAATGRGSRSVGAQRWATSTPIGEHPGGAGAGLQPNEEANIELPPEQRS